MSSWILICSTVFLLIINLVSSISLTSVIVDFIEDVINPETDELEKFEPIVAGTPEMIINEGYPVEIHEIITKDGYILCLHRMPSKKKSQPVFLQHGLFGSSADWIMMGKRKSLAYILYDKGYDIWLGNARGNTYSRQHKNISTNDKKFWNFSFHEMGIYDLPAVLSHVKNVTEQEIMYIGHSMGTTMFYAMASEFPEASENIALMIGLAPVAFMNHVKSPVRYLAPFSDDIQWILDNVGDGEILPQSRFIQIISKFGCELNKQEEKICANIAFLFCGFDEPQFNYTLLPIVLNNVPAGCSTKTLVHYAQEIVSKKFRQYDYGKKLNMEIYGSREPPNYDIENIRVPIVHFYSENDWLSSIIDVKRLENQLPNLMESYKVNYTKFNHIDYIYGIDAPKLVYSKIISTLKKNL